MRLRSIRIRNFGCVEQADVELGAGLNVLYGPNDLGKSTMVHAIRAGLLLPASHKEAESFRPWHRDVVPEVTLVFEASEEPGSALAPRTWRVHKSFGGRKAEALLEWSSDGTQFELEQKGSGVDAKLRQMLGWGVPEARARGTRGFPGSFLSTVLLGPQATPGSVLDRSLDDDPSESGRERLTEALQALAQDPLFKEVLDQAQRKVDEAFTSTGKKSKAKKSPLFPIKEQIKVLSERLEDLDVRVHDSDDVRHEVLRLDALRAEAIVDRDEVEERHREASAAYERGQRRATMHAKVEQAQAALDEARERLAERRTWHEAVERHLADCPAAEAALARAREAEEQAAHTLVRAQSAKQAIEEGGDAEARLERQGLETRRLSLRAAHEQAHTRLRTLDDLIALVERVEASEQRLQALAHDVAAAERAAAEADAAGREAQGEARLFDAALRLRRWEQAKERIAQVEAEQTEATRLRSEADAMQAAAQSTLEGLAEQTLPDASTLDAWRALDDERRMAQARLGVGLSAMVRAGGGTAVEVERDDEAPTSMVPGQAVEAERRLVLRLADGTEVEIQGGAAGARAKRDALQERWANEVEPTLARLAVDDVGALVLKVREASTVRAEAERSLRDAEAKRGLAAAREERADELEPLRRTLAAAESALAGLDRDALKERAASYDEAALQQRKAHAEARVDEARHRHADTRSKAAGLTSQRHERAQEHERLVAQLREAKAAVNGDPEVERDAAFDRLAAVEGEQEAIDAELAALSEAQAERRAEAKAAFQEAQAEADQTRTARAHAEQRLTQRRESLAEAQGRLAQLEAVVKRIDEVGLQTELDSHREALRQLPVDEVVVTAEALAEVEAERASRAQTLREVEAELDQQRGALKQVGGAVAREDADRTRDALTASKQVERDLELDYDAWQLLAKTLREAETAEGRHLGDALGEPVRERFATLTKGRYGGLTLGRDLKATGLEVAGDLRDVGAFSEGVQDQLATILRLAVAENLGTALVLDDHLAQTDPGRVSWFRTLLLDVGKTAQIVVLTCRPEDYLREGEQGLRAIDLTKVIQRA